MDGVELGTLIGAGVNFGAFSLVAWLVRHTFSHTIPRLAEDFQKMLTAQRESAIATITAERTTFIEETKAARSAFLEDSKSQRRDFLEELRRLSAESAKERHDCIARLEALQEKFDELADTVKRGGRAHG